MSNSTTLTRLLLFLTLFSTLVLSVYATPQPSRTLLERHERRWTNAQRLARGLGIAPPNFFKRRTSTAKRSTPSSTPGYTTLQGNILCTYANGTALGWMRQILQPGSRAFIPNRPTADKLVFVEVTYPTSPLELKQELELRITKDAIDYDWIGATTGYLSPSSDIGPGSYSFLIASGTGRVDKGAAPFHWVSSFSRGQGLPAGDIESAIWTLDPTTKTLGVKWVNSDYSRVTGQLFYEQFAAGGFSFRITGDFDAVNAHWPGQYARVNCVIDDSTFVETFPKAYYGITLGG